MDVYEFEGDEFMNVYEFDRDGMWQILRVYESSVKFYEYSRRVSG